MDTKLNKPKQAVILAGGLGTRLRPLTNNLPKPMIDFHGKPFLEYLIVMLKEQGFYEVVLLLGYLPEKIQNYFGDGKKFGINIIYSISPVQDETGARIRKAYKYLDEIFLLMYCDNYWPMNFEKMWECFNKKNIEIQITVYENKDNYTKSNLKINNNSIVEVYDKSRTLPGLQGVDIGYAIIKKNVVDVLPDENVNFEKIIYSELAKNGKLGGYKTRHRYYSVGDLKRIEITKFFLKREPAIILDRDGVLNEKAPKACYVTKPSEFKWIQGAKEAIYLLKEKGYRIFIISNQAGIARGIMTENDLEKVHDFMKKSLMKTENDGTNYIDKIYYCPHHWEDNCECRKPKPGMIYQAQREFNLDLSRICFIGDDIRDKEAGDAAGCVTYLVDEERTFLNIVNEKVLV